MYDNFNIEYYKRYAEDIIPEGTMYFKGLKCNDNSDLEIQFVNLEYEVTIIFEGSIKLLRDIEEFACFDIWTEIQFKQGQYFFYGWNIFTVENSELIDWLVKISDDGFKFSPIKLVHYCITPIERWIDVITTGEPKITVKKLK